jgi:hypothetical protein
VPLIYIDMKRCIAALARPTRVLAALLLGLAAVAVVATPAEAAVAEFRKDSQWGGGYVGQFTVRNDEAAALAAWRVEFDLPSGTSVSHHWGAELVRSSTTHHIFTGPRWKPGLAPGESFTFGFLAAGTAEPMNCLVNGAPCGGVRPPGQDINPPTTPGNLRRTLTSQTLTFSWDPSTDDTGVVAYEVFANGNRVASLTGTSYTTGIPPPMVIAYGVRAVDAAGNASPFAFNGLGTPSVETQAPTRPTGLTMTFTSDVFTVNWTASTDNVMVAGYQVTFNGQQLASVGNTRASARRTSEYGTFAFTVRAFDPAGNLSPEAFVGIGIDPPPPRP